MNLQYRVMRTQDCTDCFRILAHDDGYPKETWDRLPRIWSSLIQNGSLNAIVIRDKDRPLESQVVQMGASVFVSKEFLNHIKAAPPRCLSLSIFDAHLSGRSPILTRRQVAQANANGELNLVVLHSGLDFTGMSENECRSLTSLGPETFLFIHSGFQIAEIVVQPPDEHFRSYALNSGFRDRSQWGESASGRDLIGITRSEALSQLGTYIARAFLFQVPKFGFNQIEQELLMSALCTSTDTEIASDLSIAVATVKSRWRSIYDKAAELFPDIHSAMLPSKDPDSIRRTSEKRRHLLAYLRLHPEELRPFDSKSTNCVN